MALYMTVASGSVASSCSVRSTRVRAIVCVRVYMRAGVRACVRACVRALADLNAARVRELGEAE